MTEPINSLFMSAVSRAWRLCDRASAHKQTQFHSAQQHRSLPRRMRPSTCSFPQALAMALTNKRRSFLAWFDDRPAGSTVMTCKHTELSRYTLTHHQHTIRQRLLRVRAALYHKRCSCKSAFTASMRMQEVFLNTS